MDRFWAQIEDEGTPLVEPIDSDDADRWATLLWRGGEDTKNVALIDCYLVHPNWRDDNYVLRRLDDSDVWFKTFRVPADARASYLLSPNNPGLFGLQVSQRERAASWLVDPRNRHPWSRLRNEADYADDERPESPHATVSTVTLPRASTQPWIVPQPDVPAGQIAEQRVRSALLGNERRVWVYTPPGYSADGAAYPLLVCFDGFGYVHYASAPTTLDNLQQAGKLPPVVAVFVDTPLPTRGHELPCNDRFAEFVTLDLLPWLRSRYAVSAEPSERAVAG